MSKNLILRPRLSEKAYGLSEALNTYVFDVPAGANSHSVAAAVARQYGVGVKSVRIASVPGKSIRLIKRRTRSIDARRSDIRKAYVTLKQGDKLPIFQAVEQEVKTEKEKK